MTALHDLARMGMNPCANDMQKTTQAYLELGSALLETKRFPEALARYREAQALEPDNADIYHKLGWALQRMRRWEDAVESYRQAVQRAPLFDGSYNNMANCLQTLGRLDEAHEAYRRAIEIAPENGAYYRNLVQSASIASDDPCFISMQKLLERADSLSPDNQAHLHFAFGHVLAQLGQVDESFAHLLKANALHRPCVGYNEAKTLEVFSYLRKQLSADALRPARARGEGSESPIFIVGMPRSGSTLIEQILASHPQVFGLGERCYFGEALLNTRVRANGEGDDRHVDVQCTDSAAQLASIGAAYLRRVQAAVPEAATYRRITDKCLFNFMHIGMIHLALPNARIIHSRRAPVETCLSIFSRLFRDIPFGYELGELGRYYRAYDALMEHWRHVLPEGVMIEVQYEDLVDDFEANVRRMLAHCGLDWNARCLSFHQTRREVNTASASQVRKPLFRTALKRRRPAAALLQPLYDGLGAALLARDGECAEL